VGFKSGKVNDLAELEAWLRQLRDGSPGETERAD
jgi:hypothetical protein